ncbi:MAG: acetyl-CoA C-acyltransferase [Myxococcales bacterium]|nr:acetyl-CoA C-acyltransferase [Myxococcales bacterium]
MATPKKNPSPAKKATAKKATAKKAPAKKAPARATTKSSNGKRRAVVVAGVRTPFVKAFAELMELDTIALGVAATRALLDKTGIPRDEIEAIIWGGVVLPANTPNLAREIALDLQLPPSVQGYTVTRACASGMQAITNAVAEIERGEADVIIAGGSESTSNATVPLPAKAVRAVAPIAFGKAKGLNDYIGVLAQLMPLNEVLPKMPKIAERTTGEVMGESAERMARRNEISREAQDVFAVRSHHRAAEAVASGRFDDEITPVEGPDGWVHADTIIRASTSVEQLAKLRPAFAKDGTVTAGNASPLTDGASAVLIMSEDKARALGYEPLAAFRSWSYVGVDPADQLLIGPAISMPNALARAGMGLSDIDLIDIHEAFAAQVLSVTKALGSKAFASERLGRSEAVGEIDDAKLNVHGGSIAIGHPFGATGARMVTTMANELHRTGKATALLGICAAGGLAAGAVMERV